MSELLHVIKPVESPEAHIALLKEVAEASKAQSLGKEKLIYSDIKKLRMGHDAERNAAHMISHYAMSLKTTFGVVINNLRLEIGEATAQIDHLFLSDKGNVILFETKSFSTGIKIDDRGQFWRWDGYNKRYIEIPSPIKQSERHIAVLQKALDSVGFKSLHIGNIVLVDYKAKLIKPDKLFPQVCRPDGITGAVDGIYEQLGVWGTLKTAGKLLSNGRISREVLKLQAEALCALHKPPTFNVWQSYGVPKIKSGSLASSPAVEAVKPAPAPIAKGASVPAGTHKPAKEVSPPKEKAVKEKLTSSEMAKALKIKIPALHEAAEAKGLIVMGEKGYYQLTNMGKAEGLEHKFGRYKWYFLWPRDISLS